MVASDARTTAVTPDASSFAGPRPATREAAGPRRAVEFQPSLVRSARPLESAVWAALHDVHDPEIPVISVVDLGVVRSVRAAHGSISVELLPTFVGCPAIDVMRSSVEDRLRDFADDVQVRISFAEPWTSERITPAGREALRAAGFAPPSPATSGRSTGAPLPILPTLPVAQCPYCGSRNTTLENAFGPTACRAIYHCASCRQPFEQFKEV